VFVDQTSPIFSSRVEGDVVDQVFFFPIFDVIPFRRYSRSKSKVFKNRAEIWTVFALPKFRGQAFQTLYGTNSSPVPRGTPPEKFREDTPTNLIIPALSRESYFVHMFTVLMNEFGCGRFGRNSC